MNTIFTTPLTQEEECKRAIAKVYALLLRLADEVQNTPKLSQSDFKETSEPLQQNTPSEV